MAIRSDSRAMNAYLDPKNGVYGAQKYGNEKSDFFVIFIVFNVIIMGFELFQDG